MSVNDELARALGHIYQTNRAGQRARITLGGTTQPVTVIIDQDMRLGSDSGGFTNRYDNRADGNIAERWLVSFQKSEVTGVILAGVELELIDTGERYELHAPVELLGQAEGEITYGAAKF